MPLLNINSQDLPKISLTLSMWKKAKDFADNQTNYPKAQQVYLNTLAVLSVNQYLQQTGIKTDLHSSNGYSFTMQTMLDNAELNLPQYGVIDCRPIHESQKFLIIPEEVSETTISHLAVVISQDFSAATLLGFIPQAEKTKIPLQELISFVDFTKFLEDYRSTKQASTLVQNSRTRLLNGWLSTTNEQGWLDLTSQIASSLGLNLLETSERSLVFRNSVGHSTVATGANQNNKLLEGVSKIKLWELNPQDHVAVIVKVFPPSGEEVDISIQIAPIDNNPYLPEGITIKVLDDQNKTILQVETTADNDKIEFFLSGQPQEVFTVQGIYAHQVQTERFVI